MMTSYSMPDREPDGETANAIVRPPLLFLAALMLGLVADHVVRLPAPVAGEGWEHQIAALVAAASAIAGVFIFAVAIRNFRSAGTPVPGTKPVAALVTTGIHGRSRNPIYVGMLLIYLGIGLALRSTWLLALIVPIALILRYGVVAREEVYLERRFGEAYREYKSRVRRWL